jgi:type I restriction enzyme S subunit
MSFEPFPKMKIGSFAQVKGGKRMPAGASLVTVKTKHPYIRIVDFKDGSINKLNLQYVPEDIFPKISRYIITAEDIYISIVGTIGLIGTVPQELTGANLTENAAKVCQIDTSKVDRAYLAYFLRSDAGQSIIHSLVVGSTQPKLALFRIEEIEVPCPPIKIQRAIADTLGALDERIALLRETNTTLESIAQALFKSWFVDFDPVHANTGTQAPSLPPEVQSLFPSTFVESPLGLVPEGWSISTLGEICNFYGGRIQTGPFGSQLHAADYIAEGIPVVMPKDIVNRRVDTSSVARIDTQNVERLSRHKLLAGDILFSRRGDVEKHALIGHLEEGWICGTGCLLVRPGSLTVSGFLSLALNQPVAKKWLTQHAVGATMPNLNTGILSNIPIIFPSVAALENFQHLIDSFESKISSNNHSAQILCGLRDTLLPRLISGQLRLPEVEEILQ